jgi:hypothetical protein
MSNCGVAWQFPCRTLYVNVDPLFVASRLSKLLNALLCYFHPIAYPDFGANCGLDLVKSLKIRTQRCSVRLVNR